MVIDASALVAVLFAEPEAEDFALRILATAHRCMSVANWFEAAIVIDVRGSPVTRARFDSIIADLGIELVALTPAQAATARQAYRDFGKGSRRARLNFGDCFAYALAKELDQPLLFKGNDFSKTDIRSALA